MAVCLADLILNCIGRGGSTSRPLFGSGRAVGASLPVRPQDSGGGRFVETSLPTRLNVLYGRAINPI